jgi:hypothetical protein|nr:MAG TPA: hypothetical protein [Caudoviricetes sp.]
MAEYKICFSVAGAFGAQLSLIVLPRDLQKHIT